VPFKNPRIIWSTHLHHISFLPSDRNLLSCHILNPLSFVSFMSGSSTSNGILLFYTFTCFNLLFIFRHKKETESLDGAMAEVIKNSNLSNNLQQKWSTKKKLQHTLCM
jgi:hypothetical protein